jgi:hypothetical protein
MRFPVLPPGGGRGGLALRDVAVVVHLTSAPRVGVGGCFEATAPGVFLVADEAGISIQRGWVRPSDGAPAAAPVVIVVPSAAAPAAAPVVVIVVVVTVVIVVIVVILIVGRSILLPALASHSLILFSAFFFARLLAMRSRSLIFLASRFASVSFARI